MSDLGLDRWVSMAGAVLLPISVWGRARAVPILMYHSVSDDPEAGRGAYYRLCTPPGLFRQQVGLLRNRGYRGVGLDRLLPECDPAAGVDSGAVVITFDDGYRDNLTKALPVLEEFGFSATVYLPTDYIREQRRSFAGRECLSWSEVREMRGRGIRFGSHTHTHPILYQLSWTDIERELRISKEQLEDRLQEPITSFAHPYAFPQQDNDYVARLRDLLLACGYTTAVTTIIGRVHAGDDSFKLRRLPVNSRDDLRFLQAKLDGAYDWMGSCQAALRRVKARRRRPARLGH